jgi:hypothetical protein
VWAATLILQCDTPSYVPNPHTCVMLVTFAV